MRATGKVLGMRISNDSLHPRKLKNYSFNCFPMKQFNFDNDRKGSRIRDFKKVKCASARKTAMKCVDRSGDLIYVMLDITPNFFKLKTRQSQPFLNILK